MNQQKSTAETHLKIDTMYNDLNGKYEAVWTHVKKLDVQVAQTAEAVKRPHGTLPGKGETNPRNEYVAQVELRSGRKLLPAAIPPKRSGKEKVDENQRGTVDRAASGVDQAVRRLVISGTHDPTTYSCSCRDCSSQSLHTKVPYPVPRKEVQKRFGGSKV
ncbi:unnamed protein product [Microthlaspi erraticum]|uniref:Uncharacterized protein n=1 Tax=Microthlaspi erraticum TaxID=1685480 RepID=A0A6D2J2F1_9BRAS|nr:unnamed protein product [Microthlaspi erraticum]